MSTLLKELEKEKRVNDAKRNVMIAEAKVELHRQAVRKIELNEDITDVHIAAKYRWARVELDSAERDLQEAKELVSTAEADPETLEKIMEHLWI